MTVAPSYRHRDPVELKLRQRLVGIGARLLLIGLDRDLPLKAIAKAARATPRAQRLGDPRRCNLLFGESERRIRTRSGLMAEEPGAEHAGGGGEREAGNDQRDQHLDER